jgi:hypothetical protein
MSLVVLKRLVGKSVKFIQIFSCQMLFYFFSFNRCSIYFRIWQRDGQSLEELRSSIQTPFYSSAVFSHLTGSWDNLIETRRLISGNSIYRDILGNNTTTTNIFYTYTVSLTLLSTDIKGKHFETTFSDLVIEEAHRENSINSGNITVNKIRFLDTRPHNLIDRIKILKELFASIFLVQQTFSLFFPFI